MKGSRPGTAAVLGFGLLLLYVLPLFVPPAAMMPVGPAPDAGLWQRVFPGVPAWWVLGRLLALFCGAGLVAWSTTGRLPLSLGRAGVTLSETDMERRTGVSVWLALIFALGLAAAGVFAAQLGRRGEIAYFVCLAVPAIFLACGELPRTRRLLRLAAPRLVILLIVPVVWLALCAPAAWRSARAANLVDMWVFLERLEQVATGQQKILADTTTPGHTNAYMMLEGIWLLGPEHPPSFVGLQIAHAVFGVACAVIVGAAAWLMVGRGAAAVTQAALLFSPYGLSSLYEPAPMFFTCACVSSMLLMILLLRRFRSQAAVAAFAIFAAMSATDPPAAAMALVLCLLMAFSLWRLRPFPWVAVVVAILSGIAAIIPSVPTPATLVEMARQYTFGRIELAGIVSILFGQETPFAVGTVFKAGQPGPFDLPVGALLAPFAIARTPMRLWGDVLFDPVATALLAIGLALCLRHSLHNRSAILLALLLLVQLAQGFAATGDAVSHTRLAPALVPMSLLSGLAFESLRQTFADRRRALGAAAVGIAAIALSGISIFSMVTPTILPASSLAISLEAIGTRNPNADAVFLEHDPPRDPQPGGPFNLRWLHVEPVARLLPSRPLPTLTAGELRREVLPAGASPRVYLWSPALEHDANISKEICRRWPQAALYTLFDQPELYHALAAAPVGDRWQPRLPSDRWTVTQCPG